MTDPRQLAYEAKRRAWAEAHPPVVVLDAPPALHLVPPPGSCEQCDGSGHVPATAIDMVGRWVTCPACGGLGHI